MMWFFFRQHVQHALCPQTKQNSLDKAGEKEFSNVELVFPVDILTAAKSECCVLGGFSFWLCFVSSLFAVVFLCLLFWVSFFYSQKKLNAFL